MKGYNNFFQSGGTLPPGFPSYIERQADKLLYTELKKGNFCYILTARQMGKSSLRANVMQKLLGEGYACCAFDITQIGTTNITTESWYFTFLDIINEGLNLDFDIAEWWQKEGSITPVYRFFKFLKTVVLQKIKDRNIVLFFDEIDSLISIDKNQFSTDDFFASIRGMYLERANNPEFNRLSFVVIGVASPNELMNDPSRTPFNIGTSIPVENFTLDEAAVLKDGLSNLSYDADKLLKEVLAWTGGQPVLTQKVCQSIIENSLTGGTVTELVKNHVDNKFLLKPITDSDNINLLNIQTRIADNDKYGMQMLNLYEKIYKEGKAKDDTADIGGMYLKLSGMVKNFNDRLVINNKIYKEKFDENWINDIRQSIDRPFSSELQDWLALNKAQDKTLRGEALTKYEDWYNNRNDLTVDERQFYTASIAANAREETEKKAAALQIEQDKAAQQKIEAERKLAESEIESANARALASNRKGRNILLAAVVLPLILSVIAYFLFMGLQKAKASAVLAQTKALQAEAAATKKGNEANNAIDSLTRLRNRLADSLKIIETKAMAAERNRQLAEKDRLAVEKDRIRILALKNETDYQLQLLKDSLDIYSNFPSIAKLDSVSIDQFSKHYTSLKTKDEKQKMISDYYRLVDILDSRYKDPNKSLWQYENFKDSVLQFSDDEVYKQITSRQQITYQKNTIYYTVKREFDYGFDFLSTLNNQFLFFNRDSVQLIAYNKNRVDSGRILYSKKDLLSIDSTNTYYISDNKTYVNPDDKKIYMYFPGSVKSQIALDFNGKVAIQKTSKYMDSAKDAYYLSYGKLIYADMNKMFFYDNFDYDEGRLANLRMIDDAGNVQKCIPLETIKKIKTDFHIVDTKNDVGNATYSPGVVDTAYDFFSDDTTSNSLTSADTSYSNYYDKKSPETEGLFSFEYSPAQDAILLFYKGYTNDSAQKLIVVKFSKGADGKYSDATPVFQDSSKNYYNFDTELSLDKSSFYIYPTATNLPDFNMYRFYIVSMNGKTDSIVPPVNNTFFAGTDPEADKFFFVGKNGLTVFNRSNNDYQTYSSDVTASPYFPYLISSDADNIKEITDSSIISIYRSTLYEYYLPSKQYTINELKEKFITPFLGEFEDKTKIRQDVNQVKKAY